VLDQRLEGGGDLGARLDGVRVALIHSRPWRSTYRPRRRHLDHVALGQYPTTRGVVRHDDRPDLRSFIRLLASETVSDGEAVSTSRDMTSETVRVLAPSAMRHPFIGRFGALIRVYEGPITDQLGARRTMAAAPRMQAHPPETTEKRGDVSAATAPASASPRRGPPVTTAMCTAVSRPRRASGTLSWRMVLRKTAEMTSAAPPAPASRARGAASSRARRRRSPLPTRARPTPPPGPDGSRGRPPGEERARRAPAPGAAYSSPTVVAPRRRPSGPAPGTARGHAEDHGVEVDDERAEQQALARR